jgi:glutathione synthase/RimK-type ligase-like ATP-grasp enzyme
MRIGFATTADWGITTDDSLAAAALEARGATVVPVVWTEPTPADLDLLVVRSTWGYQHRVPQFAAWLLSLDHLGIPVWNPPSLLRWNMVKTYLRDLDAAGIAVTPTAWVDGKAPHLVHLLEQQGWHDAVVKPIVSASSYKTFRTTRDTAKADQEQYVDALSTGAVMVQPFLPEIAAEGEWSLVFIGGLFSHAVLKRPANDGFLVQTEYGGSAVPASPPPRLVDDAALALGAAPAPSLYARVDGIRRGDRLILLELELLEPHLFLGLAPGAEERFAEVILSPRNARAKDLASE